jgi:hypothetical protein
MSHKAFMLLLLSRASPSMEMDLQVDLYRVVLLALLG